MTISQPTYRPFQINDAISIRLLKVLKCLGNTVLVFVLITYSAVLLHGQSNPRFLETEIAIGKIVGNYPNFPPNDFRSGITLSYGVHHTDTTRIWPRWMNFPATGLTLGVHRLGNDAIYGYETNLIPFVAFSPSKSLVNRLWFRMGMGASYFNRHYFSGDNTSNRSIGSALNWAFQVHAYKNWNIGKRLDIRAGIGYLHASNGHTQIPNFGLNSFAAEVAATFYLNEPPEDRDFVKPLRPSHKKPLRFHKRLGIGLHEYGGTTGPVGGAKRPVYAATMGMGIQMRKPWFLKAGFTYRYYTQVNQIYLDNENKNNHWQASNLFFNIGSEFIMGHFGIDVEVGLNIFKPFYRDYFEEYERGLEFHYFIKRMFPSRFGMNAYLISNEKDWNHNLYLGAFICANFGEADFTEVSLTYVRRIRRK